MAEAIRDLILDNIGMVILYLFVINLVGFLSMGIDKTKAQHGMWRTKEKTLFTIALIGGSIGSIWGMYFFRHKTQHNTFIYGMPMILIAQIATVIYLWFM